MAEIRHSLVVCQELHVPGMQSLFSTLVIQLLKACKSAMTNYRPGYLRLFITTLSSLRVIFKQALFKQSSPSLPPDTSTEPLDMSTSTLTNLLSQIQSSSLLNPEEITSLLTQAKRQLLTLNALLPTPTTPPHLLSLARQTLETGALLSIRAQDPDAFTRYYQQLLPFYELSETAFERGTGKGQRSKVTGLYLLLLLTKGDYAGFHTVLEGLEIEEAGKGGLDKDQYIQYPVKLEQWLMEGSYDRVWGACKREGVPSEEYGVFSEVSGY